MSGNKENKYTHVRSLIASLHAPKNVARPPTNAWNPESINTESTAEATEDVFEEKSAANDDKDARKLSILQEEVTPRTSVCGSAVSLSGLDNIPLSTFQSIESGSIRKNVSPAPLLFTGRRASHDTVESISYLSPEFAGSNGDSSRESSPKRNKSNSICVSTETGRLASARRKGASFLHLHLLENIGGGGGASGSQSAAPMVHIPTFTITAPAESAGRKLSSAFHGLGAFAMRRHSTASLHRTESMVSLCFRPLSNIISDDNLAALQAFLAANKQIQIDDRDENGTTALMVACQRGRPSMVSELLAHGADPNAEDNDGWTGLMHAAKQGRTNICTNLLDHGANIHQREMGGWSPLMWASYKGHEDVVTLLLERGADVNAHGNFHISSLVWAAGRGHSAIVDRLLSAGARPNIGDKYGTTALIWAARRGDSASVRSLLAAGALPDQAGMYSWTALLQATQGNHMDIVQMLLEHKPNVNALDKDGCNALTLACKEGFYEIAAALLNSGAYINIQDRGGDTCLIHAVKGGHRSVVEALLKKYADVDVLGKDRKTAVYTAVEKGHTAILKLLLHHNPDLELSTKDGDTPLLRAVRSRNADMVQLLLDKKSKVNAADKRGDTCLHIAMRARSKAIVEILLRNPKNSQLLYRPNRSQETPYNIDMNYPKTILGQIFGARRLNTNDDNESLLGYELYSSALADMLSEPSLSMPITVGLYARWGSGKSFLLGKLRDEMKNFARQWEEIGWRWGWVVMWGVWHAGVIGGAFAMLVGASWILSLSMALLIHVLLYVLLSTMWFASHKYEWSWPYTVMLALSRKFNSLKLVLQVVFCHPPGPQCSHTLPSQPIRFHFTDQAKSSTQEGEASVIQMVVSLSEALENQYGRMCTRLYRAFRPKPIRATADWRWRRVCCIPHIIAFELCFISVVFGICVLILYIRDGKTDTQSTQIQEGILMGVGALISVAAIANLYTLGRIGAALLLSPRSHIKRSVDRQPEGFLQALRPEVTLLTDMVKCLDAFTGQQTRLVVVVDALDSCEQDRVLIVLNAIHTLCSDQHSPFIIILAIDPHIISKAVEVNSRRAFSESNIGGWDYLRNMVQLPFYLQNSALRRVKIAQQTSQRKQTLACGSDDISASLQRSVSARRLSSASELMSSQEKLKGLGTASSSRNARKLKISESVASSMQSNLHKAGLSSGPADLNRVLLTDDYFSDVNPRSMRRLMNVLYITGRLLKAFQIEFNWYHLASWVNLTEQWPFRTSWIILHHEMFEEHIEDGTSLKQIYDKVRPNIPILREAEPLMELDRDERKLDVFLGIHRTSLLAADLKIFLPFTINLDPYIKKVIKDEQQQHNMDTDVTMMNPAVSHKPYNKFYNHRKQKVPTLPPIYGGGTPGGWPNWSEGPTQITAQPSIQSPIMHSFPHPHGELSDVRLSRLSIGAICTMIERELPGAAPTLTPQLRRHNISGRVLRHCDLPDLKEVLELNFGDWELFKLLVLTLRELESGMPPNSASHIQEKERPEKETKSRVSLDSQKTKQSNMEKQVTLEEQMICGALQTLNEEALEDVLLGEPPVATVSDESESIQLVLLAPGGGWQATTPPTSVSASPQLPRKADPSILKPKGSVKRASKKHVSINEKGFSFGSDSSLKNMEMTPIIVKFENETEKPHPHSASNINRYEPDCNNRLMTSESINNSDSKRRVSLQNSKNNEVVWQNLQNQTDIDKSVAASQLSHEHCNVDCIVVSAENPPCMINTGEISMRINSKNSKRRPSSLLIMKDDPDVDPDKLSFSTRSKSADSSSQTNDASGPENVITPKNQTSGENVEQSSNVELITRLKEKIFSRNPSTDKIFKTGDFESDDESTPLVSSERSSPSISIKIHRNISKDDCKSNVSVQNPSNSSDSSSPHSSPASSKYHSPIQTNKRKRFNKNDSRHKFSSEKVECITSDATVSVEFSPTSDHSSSESHHFKTNKDSKCESMYYDTLPINDEAVATQENRNYSRNESPDENKSIAYSRSPSIQSLTYLLDTPQSVELLARATSDSSLRSSLLWRQDALDDQEDWKNPESSV